MPDKGSRGVVRKDEEEVSRLSGGRGTGGGGGGVKLGSVLRGGGRSKYVPAGQKARPQQRRLRVLPPLTRTHPQPCAGLIF